MSIMLHTRLYKAFSILFMGLFLTSAALAQADREQEIRTLLEERDQEIKTVLGDQDEFTQAQREELKAVINDGIDFRAMGREALGPYWSDLTEAQQTEYVELFTEIVRAQSLSDLDVYRSTVAYGEIAVEGDSARVVTTTTYDNKNAEVVYELHTVPGGGWLVGDIILDEVSTEQGYARSFQSAVRKRGFDGLMTSLRKKRDKLEAQNTADATN